MPSIIDVKPPVYATATLGDCKNRNAKKAHPVIIKKNLSSIFILLGLNSSKNSLRLPPEGESFSYTNS
tara:strand:+ start:110 stop:313 length:204 start_codon:yes stop_codon:yes gene_type:complete